MTHTSAEQAIIDAIDKVSKAGIDPRITEAIIKLQEAKALLSAYVDAKIGERGKE